MCPNGEFTAKGLHAVSKAEDILRDILRRNAALLVVGAMVVGGVLTTVLVSSGKAPMAYSACGYGYGYGYGYGCTTTTTRGSGGGGGPKK